MTEIFISYSRRDRAFVERFLTALHNNGYSTENIWVDWEDIPASSKWEDEIRKGIEASNSIIFILSPEWAASNECAKELQIAAEYNKRLFPIVWQNVDPKTIHGDLASLNWIFFREADNFDEAMQKLLAALNTDLSWVAQHTDLLRRANEWDTKGRDNGYLLRGSELQSAEAWLSQASENKQPRPTPLQSEYIFTSRQDDVRRQRRNLVWVSTGLVISVLLAIAALVSGLEALRQSQRALASQLAAQSTNLVNTQPDLSLLLSLESNFIGDELEESDPAWLGSLVTSLNNSPSLGTYLRAHDSDVRAVAFSSDGHWLASTGNASSNNVGQVIVWDMTSNANPRPYQKFTGGTQRFLAVAFSPDNKQLVAAGDESKLFVWDPQKCCDPIHAWPVTNKVRALAFVNLSGKEYVATGEGNEVHFWNIADGTSDETRTFVLPTKDKSVRILSLAVASDNSALAVGSEDGNVTVWDLNAGKVRFQQCSFGDPKTNDPTICNENGQGNTDVRGLTFSPDGKLLVTGSSDTHAWLWNAMTGELLAQTPIGSEGGHLNTIASIDFDSTNTRLATASWDNTIRLWDLKNDQGRWRFQLAKVLTGHSSSIWAVDYSADGKWLASGSSDTTVILWKAHQVNQIGIPFAQLGKNVWGLTVSPNGKQLAAGDETGNIQLWNYDGHILSKFKTLNHPGGVLTLAYSNNGQWLTSAGFDKTIRVWNIQTGQEAWQIDNAHEDQIWSVMFSPDDKWLASASYDKTAKIWDVATQKQLGVLQHEESVYALTFNNDGTQLLVAGFGDNIYVWDMTKLASNQTPKLLSGHSAAVNSLTVNPVYHPLLASTSDDKTLLIWNLDTQEHTPKVLGLNESMQNITFSPNGNQLASATDNKTVLLWELDSQRCSQNWNKDTCSPSRLGAPLIGHKTSVESVVFLSNMALVSSSEDGQLILWDLSKPHWYQRACEIVNRSLTKAEYSQYVQGKINLTLLHVVKWFSGFFGNQPKITPPSCIADAVD